MSFNEALSRRIDELLEDTGLSQYEVATKGGIAPQCISDIRHQKNKTNAVNILFFMAYGFGISLAKFFDTPLFEHENITD